MLPYFQLIICQAQATEMVIKFATRTDSLTSHYARKNGLTVNQRGRNPKTEGSAAKTIQVKARATLCLTCKDEPQKCKNQ
jgi:hypothetical protein